MRLGAVFLDSRNVFVSDGRYVMFLIGDPPSDITLSFKLPFFITFFLSTISHCFLIPLDRLFISHLSLFTPLANKT
jgi:hypothetical protein